MGRNPASAYGGRPAGSSLLFGLVGLVIIALAVAGIVRTADDGTTTAAPGGTAGPTPSSTPLASGAAQPSAGCTATQPAPPAAGAALDATLEDQGRTRDYRITLPAGYQQSQPTPVLLLFHGTGGTPDAIEKYTGVVPTATARGYAVVTPQGLQREGPQGALPAAWSVPGFDTGVNDVTFVEALIKDLGSKYCLDLNRVDATGISAGGAFPAYLACESALLAAFAPIAGANLIRPCTDGRPISYLGFHGTADQFVSYAGVPEAPENGDFFNGPALDVAASWAQRDGCSAYADTPIAPDVTRRVWSGCTGVSGVEQYTVDGGGHTWPGADPAVRSDCCGVTTATISANTLMLDFFQAHPRVS